MRLPRRGPPSFFFAAAAQAQVFRLGAWGGALEGVTEYHRGETSMGGASGPRSEDLRTEERLSLRTWGGYIYHPRLVAFGLGGDFALSQDRSSFDGRSFTRNGTLMGYDGLLWILPEALYSLTAFANRQQTIRAGGLAGRTEVVSESRGATLFAKATYVPSTVTVGQRVQSEESRVGTVVTRREETRNSITYLGERGWEDSEASLRYEFVDLSDRVSPGLGYQSHEGALYYSLDLGPELNWRWDSRLRFFTRTGATQLNVGTLHETLRIDHTDRLQTNYRYSLLRTETAGGASTVHSGGFYLRHRLYESLTTNLGLDGTFQTLPGGQQTGLGGRMDLEYTKRIPWDGRLNIGLGAGLHYDDRRFRAPETFVPQEPHAVATPFAFPIQLRNPLVVPASVVVTKTGLGPLPAGCVAPPGPPTPLVLGRDYTLRTAGDITEIVPIPCAGVIPGINPGDTIAADYRFAVPTSLALASAAWSLQVSVDYGWIRPYLILERTDQRLVSGRDGQFLDDVRSETIGTELRYERQRLRARLVAEARRYASRRVAYDTVRANQFLAFSILPELTVTLSADEAVTASSMPRRQTWTFTGRATGSYAFSRNLSADAFTGARLFQETAGPAQRTLEAGLRVRWTYRNIQVDPTLEFLDQQRGETDTKDLRAILRVIRRF